MSCSYITLVPARQDKDKSCKKQRKTLIYCLKNTGEQTYEKNHNRNHFAFVCHNCLRADAEFATARVPVVGQEVNITVADEKRLTQEALPKMLKDYPPPKKKKKKKKKEQLQKYVSKIGMKIVRANNLKAILITTPLPW